jgi:hypothetical protein
MAPSNKTPFEIIRGQTAPDKLRVPNWWRGSKRDKQPPEDSGKAAWLMRPVTLRLNRAMALGLCAVIGAALVVAYEVGVSRSGGSSVDARSTAEMADLRRQQLNARLMRTDDGGSTGSGEAASGSVVTVTHTDPDRVLFVQAGTAADPREPGMNYFCLATMPPKYRGEAEKAVRFLQHNRVDAAIVSVDNRWLQIIALKGFARSTSDAADDYERLLRALGKAWKAEHRGWSDWQDLYAIKYRP